MQKITQGGDVDIKMEVDTEFEEHRLQTLFTKEPETISWIAELMSPGDVLVDIGANIGVFSLYAGIKHGGKVEVFAFEPAYHNFDKLCRNIVANGLSASCRAYCLAIGDKTGLDSISLVSEVSGSASHFVGAAEPGMEGKVMFEQGVMAVTLDEAVKSFGLPMPNHIKIDTDGFEERVLAGGSETFRNPSLKSVLLEVTDVGGARERIMEFMAAAGFRTDHPINTQENHSRARRQKSATNNIENIIFTR